MPLSDREQQILSDIEAHLRAEDPRLVRAVGTTSAATVARGRLKLAAVLFVVGLVMLFGLAAHFAWGLAGSAVMLGSAVYAGNQLSRAAKERPSRQRRQGGDPIRRYLDRRRDG